MIRQTWATHRGPLALALAACIMTPPAPAAPPGEAGAPATATYPDTPEGALQTFLLALGTGDEAKLREITLPADGFEWLLKGQRIPPAKLGEYRKGFVEGLPIRRLKPGDGFTLPGGRKLKVQPEEVTEDRAVLLQEGAPTPTRCQKVEGHWRVDARPVIAGRKAAEAARSRAREKSRGVDPKAGSAQP